MSEVAPELAVGSLVGGRFRVDGVLGRGGFGTTYAGVEVASGRPVAIKRLDLRGLRDWKGVELFEREAAVLRRLSHPKIPAYVDFLPIEADHAGLLIQALAPGRSLQAVLAEGRLEAPQVVAIAEQVLEILIYLGDLEPPVVHRDVKPANLVIDDEGVVRLVDFGAVKDAAARTATFGSTVAGTFGFMAPELLSGQGEPRSDLFSLGMTMIALLTGCAPAELPQRRLRPDYRGRVAADEAILRVIDRLIEPVPEDRFEDARAARHALADARSAATRALAPAQDLAAIVEDQRRAARQAASAAASAAEQARARTIEALARRPSRISVSRGDSGLRVRIAPPLVRDVLLENIIEVTVVPLTIGPIVAIFASVMAGLSWLAVAALVVAVWGLAVLVVSQMKRGYVIDVAPTGHFAIYERTPRRPDLVGMIDELRVDAGGVRDDRLNEVTLARVGSYAVEIKLLTAGDVQRLREALRPPSRAARPIAPAR